MTKGTTSILPLIAAVLVAWPGIAPRAADPDLPPPDPPFHWRYVTQDSATTDSQCIGDPKTPECAIDTFHACYVREIPTLCEAIGKTFNFTPNPRRGLFFRYRILSSRRLTAASAPPSLYGVGRLDWQPGDIEVVTRDTRCNDGDCGVGDTQLKFVLRKSADRWMVVDKGAPREP